MALADELILAIDQGTTGTKVLLFGREAEVRGSFYRELTQYYPRPGWVEHDAAEIWEGVMDLIERALAVVEEPRRIRAIAVTNQRETVVAWERATGRPLARAVVWQCRRSAEICRTLRQECLEETFRRKTGLTIDPYFSGTKVRWLLDEMPGLKARAARGEVCFGTIDAWLLWNLTGGKVFATDYSNAARTLLFNIYDLDWDEELLAVLGVPRAALPEARPSSHLYGETVALGGLPAGIPIAAMIGDSQAALFGEACFTSGMAKATYGTGTSLMVFAGPQPIQAPPGLVATVAWGLGREVGYAYEGLINVTGATMQWLRDGLGIIEDVAESSAIASRLSGNDGVYLVPAFVGLAAPYWDMEARGLITGLTRGTTRAHLIRAGLESIGYQVREVVDLIREGGGLALASLRADGGAAENEFLMQFQADLLDVEVVRPRLKELSALGAAYLAGLQAGFWADLEEIAATWRAERVYRPKMEPELRERYFAEWKGAVARALRRPGDTR